MGFELQLKTSNEKQKIFYTTFGGNDVIVTIDSLYVYIQKFVLSPEQQEIFNESIISSFKQPSDSWVRDRKPASTGREYQLDIDLSSTYYCIY